MQIERMIAKTHCYLGQNKPNYVIIHETDNWSKGANAHAHATAMKNGNLAGTVHYYVDSQECYQTLEHQDGAWAVGDGHGRYGISNLNSINIEICVNPESNYYLAVDRAAELAAMLLNQYGWDTSHLKRHYDASRKHCPRRILDEGLWDNFVKCTASYMKKQGGGAAPATTPLYRVRKTWTDSKSQLGAYAVLDNAKANCPSGYSVYDEAGKVIYTRKSEPVRRGMQATELKGLNAKELITKIGRYSRQTRKKAAFWHPYLWRSSSWNQAGANPGSLKKRITASV